MTSFSGGGVDVGVAVCHMGQSYLQQFIAVRCNVLQCVGNIISRYPILVSDVADFSVLQCVTVCCSVLQCAAVCCSVLQCVAIV